MKVIEVIRLVAEGGSPDKALTVVRTDDGWYWIHKLVLQEGFVTPFFSIQEIEVALGKKLKVVRRRSVSD